MLCADVQVKATCSSAIVATMHMLIAPNEETTIYGKVVNGRCHSHSFHYFVLQPSSGDEG
jgi:hypothetical protein